MTDKRIYKSIFLLSIFGLLHCHVAWGIEPDSLWTRELSEIEFTERALPSTQSAYPVRYYTTEELSKVPANQLADVVKCFSGVTVKDYGGIGGLKTVSIRSLGALHTAVAYDGVALGNAQSGQIDIGRFSLENTAFLSMQVGQNEELLQPARLFASAGVLAIESLLPGTNTAFDGKKYHVNAQFKGGSWGWIKPSLRWEQSFTPHCSLSLYADYQQADGNYPYTLSNGENSERKRRKNTDIKQGTTEANLHWNHDRYGKLNVKAYGYFSERGLPGSVLLYTDRKKQRVADRNSFAQMNYRKNWDRIQLLWNGKYAYDYTYYHQEDPAYPQGVEDNKYTQREVYGSLAVKFLLTDNWTTSLASDYTYNYLYTNYLREKSPARHTSQTAWAIQYAPRWITLSGSLLLTGVEEVLKETKGGKDFVRLSPSLGVSLYPKTDLLCFRAFYKEIFRAPTFNDLYYDRMGGNRSLNPENTSQLNLGLSFAHSLPSHGLTELSCSADYYYNRVEDKIVTMPRGNMFNWSVLNYGEVEINGIDLTGKVVWMPNERHRLDFSFDYTWQRALDRTDRDENTWGNQLPYTPVHSGALRLGYRSKWGECNYTLFCSGTRYYGRQNSEGNRLPGYEEHSLAYQYTFDLKSHGTLLLRAECINLADSNYEVVVNYPMPGRSWRMTLAFNY